MTYFCNAMEKNCLFTYLSKHPLCESKKKRRITLQDTVKSKMVPLPSMERIRYAGVGISEEPPLKNFPHASHQKVPQRIVRARYMNGLVVGRCWCWCLVWSCVPIMSFDKRREKRSFVS